MKKIVIISLMTCAIALFAKEDNKNIIPDTVYHVQIGMDWKTFVENHPNAEVFNVGLDIVNTKPDKNKPQGGLVEKYSTNLFDKAIYLFSTNKLISVIYTQEHTSSEEEQTYVVRETFEKYGTPAGINVEKNKGYGIISWTNNCSLVKLLLPDAKSNKKMSPIGLQIVELNYAKRYGLHSLPQKGDSSYTQDLNLLNKRISTILSKDSAD
ncbi:MAG: hypothetical protein PF692_15640 [Kiritimatiellae bacterium]|jgi:hypothetical protein|nr:hypothetical protein [Kiritimatiellia bacterium]